MKRRIIAILLILPMLVVPAHAKTINWVDFDVSYESMKYALEQDIATFEQEKHISWIDILALAACRTGGRCPLASVKKAAQELKQDIKNILASFLNFVLRLQEVTAIMTETASLIKS